LAKKADTRLRFLKAARRLVQQGGFAAASASAVEESLVRPLNPSLKKYHEHDDFIHSLTALVLRRLVLTFSL